MRLGTRLFKCLDGVADVFEAFPSASYRLLNGVRAVAHRGSESIDRHDAGEAGEHDLANPRVSVPVSIDGAVRTHVRHCRRACAGACVAAAGAIGRPTSRAAVG
jgi:hypothetical protein